MRDRSTFGLFHLAGSAMVAAVCWAWITLVLYPAPLASAVGLDHFFWFVLLVDVVLGPFLTFVVYKKDKKWLKLDLGMIAALQLCALAYGIFTIVQARPVWLVFNVDRFDLVQAHDLDKRFSQAADPSYRNASFLGPKWVASRSPKDVRKKNELILESALGGPDLPQRVDLYLPISEDAENIRARAHPLSDLDKHNAPATVKEILRAWPQADGWLPLMARSESKVVLVALKNGGPLAVVDLRPW